MISTYSVSEILKNVYSLIFTKITFPQCRLLRRPIYIRGGNSIEGAKKLTTGYHCRLDLEGKKKTLFIGEDCQFGDNTHIVALQRVCIGKNVLLASNVFISDTSHGCYRGNHQSTPDEAPNDRRLFYNSVEIGDNVWIGQNAVILAGSKIGKGSIVGANTVVCKEFADNSIIIGNNMLLKTYNKEIKKWVQK